TDERSGGRAGCRRTEPRQELAPAESSCLSLRDQPLEIGIAVLAHGVPPRRPARGRSVRLVVRDRAIVPHQEGARTAARAASSADARGTCISLSKPSFC